MRNAIRRIVLELFPEISGGYHLPRQAKIVGVADTPNTGDLANDFRPHYAVDLQALNAKGEPDDTIPVMKAVPLPASMIGDESGMFGYPKRGTVVTMGFAYGSPTKPTIYAVMPTDKGLPKLEEGEQLWQHSETSGQKADADGNWQRWSDRDIHDQALRYLLDAMEKIETLHKSDTTVETDSTETINGIKKILAMGALRLLSSGSLALSSLGNMAITTASNMNENIAGDRTTAVAGSWQQQVGDALEIAAATKAHIESSKCYIGDSGSNLFKMVSDLCQSVINLAGAFAIHTHGGVFSGPSVTAVPFNAAVGTAEVAASTTTKTSVDVMTE